MNNLIIPAVFVLIGLWFLLSPKSAFNFKAWWAGIFGVKMTGGEKAFSYYRVIGLILLLVAFLFYKANRVTISSFEECIKANYPVMESYPERCAANGKTFTRDVGNELEKTDIIRLTTPRPGDRVSSPLEIRGVARGTWFFEATFPIYLYDEEGNQIAVGYAEAIDDWMTEEFVAFKSTLVFDDIPPSGKATLVLEKSNPSGLPENDDSFYIPVILP